MKFSKIACDDLVSLVRNHIRTCDHCRTKLGNIFKEFPILKMIPGLETAFTSFLKGESNGNS